MGLSISKSKTVLGIILVLFFFLLFLNNFIGFSNAQTNGESFTISSKFGFYEYCQIEGLKENVSSIQIDLPEPNWTISNIQINFSDISLGSDVRVIEESETALEQIWNKNVNFRTFALATQIEILEETDLLGVYIKAYKTPQANETIKFQLQGFNEINSIPNGIIYRSINLNISTDLDWYYQDFISNPITLPIGNYSLVMNGTGLPQDDQVKYFWQKDDLDPEIPFLHSSSYITSWASGTVNSSFLCKLKISNPNQLYFPSELNMTAQFNGDNYEITDGLTIGDGFLNLSDLTHFSEEIDLNIPIMINQSLILNYDYNFSITLNNNFLTKAFAIVEESNNRWSLFPLLNSVGSNYYVKFNYPDSWYNFTISRKLGLSWDNLTSSTIIDNNTNTLLIPNSIILGGAEWRITANSPDIIFDLNLPVLDWEPGQELQFTVSAPASEGNLTFFFINSLGFGYEEPIETREISSTEQVFSYTIPSNSREGSYNILIYWNNNTDAGVQSQDFQVSKPPIHFTIDPIWIVTGVILGIVGIVGGLISYRTIKKIRVRKIEEEQKIFRKCMDIMNLDYIIVTNKRSGLSVYEQKFTSKQLNGTLISGFLQALSSFGIELMKVENQSQTIKLEYKGSIVLMSEFVNIRVILILKESPSKYLLYSLEDLAYDIYKNYGNLIDQFDGDVRKFKSIENLLIKHLNVAIVYPLRLVDIDKLENIRVSPTEKSFINDAISIMNKDTTDFFYIKDLIIEKTCSPKDIKLILKLIEKNIFQAAI